MPKLSYGVLVKHDNTIYLRMTRDKGAVFVHGFKSETEAIRFFERGYKRNHALSYEGSMSACLYHIQYQPRVIPLDEATLPQLVGRGRRLVELQGPAGGMLALKCSSKLARTMYEQGVSPQLVEVC